MTAVVPKDHPEYRNRPAYRYGLDRLLRRGVINYDHDWRGVRQFFIGNYASRELLDSIGDGRGVYRVIYHRGDSIGLKTKMQSGRAELTLDSLRIHGASGFEISFRSIRDVELFRLHRLGRMVKLSGGHGTLFLSVMRINLWGYFAIVNFRATGELHRRLAAQADT